MKYFNDTFNSSRNNNLYKLIVLVILSFGLLFLIDNSQKDQTAEKDETAEKDKDEEDKDEEDNSGNKVEPFNNTGKNVYGNICVNKPTQFYNITGYNIKDQEQSSTLEDCKNKCLSKVDGCDIYTLNKNSNNTCSVYKFSNADNLDISINCNNNIINEYSDKYEGIGYINKEFYKKAKNGIKYDNYLYNKSQEIIRDYDNIDNQLELVNNLDYSDPYQYSVNLERERNKLRDMYDSSNISVSNKLNSVAEFLNLSQNKVYSDFVKENGLANKFAAKQNDIKLIPDNDNTFYELNPGNNYTLNINQNSVNGKNNVIGYKIIAEDGVTENTNTNFKISYKNEANDSQIINKRYPGTENSLTGAHIDRIVYFDTPIVSDEIKFQPVIPSQNVITESNRNISFKLKLIVDNNLVNLGENNISYYEMLKIFQEQYDKEINDDAKLEDNKKNITSGKLLYLILSIIFVLTVLLIVLYKIIPEFINGQILASYFVIVIILLYFLNHYIT